MTIEARRSDSSDEQAGVDVAMGAQEIEDWMLAEIRALVAEGTDVERDAPFSSYGLKSRDVVALVAQMERRLHMAVPVMLAYSYPTIVALSECLAQRAVSQATARPRGELPAEEARAAVAAEVQPATEPIAIVGIGCRYPGGIRDVDGFWEVVANGVHAVTEIPRARWDVDDLFDADPDALGKTCTRFGGFIEDVDQFDPHFFGIAPREAKSMDPQHRVLLEVVWEALEHAGTHPASLMNSDAGVFVGLNAHEYEVMSVGNLEQLDGYVGTGAASSVASGRISYLLGSRGPSLTVDTACSSSLVALHLAVQSLRKKECTTAIAAGVTLLLGPAAHVEFSRLRGLAPDGRCKSFDASADGTVWSEGCGVLILKPLSKAQADGDRILALIRGTAINQDGRSNGLTAPSGLSQQELLRRALADARVDEAAISYVEAHGTGTLLGDPIEAHSLQEVLGRGRADSDRVYLGTVKSNLGHTQAAAGIAGVIKTVLALEHETIPPTLHVSSPTPAIDWSASGLSLASSPVAWPRTLRPRLAGVSSFGISGTNAHIVLEETPAASTPRSDAEPERTRPKELPLLLSSKTDQGLNALATRWSEWLQAHPDVPWERVTRTAALRFPHLDVRGAVLASCRSEALSGLEALAEERPDASVARSKVRTHGKFAFVVPGQGGQWAGMGRALLLESPAFAAAIDACDTVMSPMTGWSVRTLLADPQGALECVDTIQPALFAMSIGLAEVWRSFGVEPAGVVGHSQGEIAAAVIAGALSLEDGARVVVERSKLLRDHTGRGAMMVIERPSSEVADLIAPFGGALEIAVINTAASTVVAGETAAIDELGQRLQATGVFARKVKVDYASHSAQMDILLPELAKRMCELRPRAPGIPFYSTVMGRLLSRDELLDCDYWCRNLRQTVRFDRALEALRSDGYTAFVELSPHPVLTLPLSGACGDGGTVVDSMQREHGDLGRILKGLATLHVNGYEVDWRACYGEASEWVAGPPMHAFQRSRYWLDAAKSRRSLASPGTIALEHAVLATRAELADTDGQVFSGLISAREQPWLRDHCVYGTMLFPGTGLVDIALYAASALEANAVAELVQVQAIPLDPKEATEIQLSVGPTDTEGRRSLSLHSRRSGGTEAWIKNASGWLGNSVADPVSEHAFQELREFASNRWAAFDIEHLRERLRSLGLEYGPAFRGLTHVWRTDNAVYGRVTLPAEVSGESLHAIHPALLDAALHAMFAATSDDEELAVLPFAWSEVTLYALGARELRVKVAIEDKRGPELSASLWITDGAGEPLLKVGRLQARRVTKAQLEASSAAPVRDLYRIDLTAVAPQPTTDRVGVTQVFVGEQDAPAGLHVARRFRDLGSLIEHSQELDLSSLRIIVASAHDGSVREPSTHDELTDEGLRRSHHALHVLQTWLKQPELEDTELVYVTRAAVIGPDDVAVDPSQAAVWGLVRAVRAEQPERSLKLVDLAQSSGDSAAFQAALDATDEPELVVRGAQMFAPRLSRIDAGQPSRLVIPGGVDPWHVEVQERGQLEALQVTRRARKALEAHEVRISVRAAGTNFRDVLNALGVVAAPQLGLECAGIVAEVGESVRGLRVGDRVMGLCLGGYASEVVGDGKLFITIPAELSFAEAATIPVAYLTAMHAFDHLARLGPGKKVLIHAAAGGVGMAALQLARSMGAEVFGTASPGKWEDLRKLGLDDAHIASSRDLTFEAKFRAQAPSGLDFVLNSLAHDYVDASLRLLKANGSFLEMGKTDPRDAAQVARAHNGVRYLPFDMMGEGADHIQHLLQKIVALLAASAVAPLPFVAFDMRMAPRVLRHMAQARHVGKLVLTAPRELDSNGTVLVTGGLGQLGSALCAHLVKSHEVRHLLITSRREPAARELDAFTEQLRTLGAKSVRVVSCDVAQRAQLKDALNLIDPRHPITAVVHLAGVLDDGLVDAQSHQRLRNVFSPKAAGAVNLHELTRHADLSMFVTFSSIAATLGSPGQSNYAAANAFMDAFVAQRQLVGFAGTSLAWGLWQPSSVGMTAHLSAADLTRLARLGMGQLSASHGLALFDAALTRGCDAHLVPVRLDLSHLARREAGVTPPALLRSLLRPTLRQASTVAHNPSNLRASLLALAAEERFSYMVQRVQSEVAAALGLAKGSSVDPDRELSKLGLDSLMAVELRNRLAALVGKSIPSTVAFDYPTPAALARFLLERALPKQALERGKPGEASASSKPPDLRGIAEMIANASPQQLEQFGLLSGLLKMQREVQSAVQSKPSANKPVARVDLGSRDDLMRFLEQKVGVRS